MMAKSNIPILQKNISRILQEFYLDVTFPIGSFSILCLLFIPFLLFFFDSFEIRAKLFDIQCEFQYIIRSSVLCFMQILSFFFFAQFLNNLARFFVHFEQRVYSLSLSFSLQKYLFLKYNTWNCCNFREGKIPCKLRAWNLCFLEERVDLCYYHYDDTKCKNFVLMKEMEHIFQVSDACLFLFDIETLIQNQNEIFNHFFFVKEK